MTLTEEGRHRLHSSLAQAIGADAANTLMEMLPPVGWADIATKRDLDHLATGLRAELTELRSDMRVEVADLRSELHSTLRTNNLTMITANAVVVSVAVALARLLG